ncbi:hypothetical protein FVEG_13152 [Fusarium verticillioides 7600]|uniref:Uncharacterized protein n=1 Tax=Gibberella moniliformis (strain M3125 / FGSC 7600) TaxID=334819 RepID=W7MUB5_GIBM7|nr:hypothetical protein FVEG_13152 [Fusarium verticillioides 7600]EWG55103.1 hypothetical protein FVEG_13152 [Fusarium verticillioides 7600]
MKQLLISDKGKALCNLIKAEYARIGQQMPTDLASNLAYDLSKFTRESVMTDYDAPDHDTVFQEVTADTNKRRNSKTLLAVTFPQWFFLAVTLGANNPSLAPVKEIMETHCGCEFSSKDIDFNSLPVEKYDELFTDINIGVENTEGPLEKVLSADSLAGAIDEEGVDQVSLCEVLGDIRHDIANLEEKVNDVVDIADSLATDIPEIKKNTD